MGHMCNIILIAVTYSDAFQDEIDGRNLQDVGSVRYHFSVSRQHYE